MLLIIIKVNIILHDAISSFLVDLPLVKKNAFDKAKA